MNRKLAREYVCRFGAPVLAEVDVRIFTLSYFGTCLDCTFCHDSCCQYGADAEVARLFEIDKIAPDLEQYLGVKREEWFRLDEDDFGVADAPEYPGGRYTRTRVVELPPGRSAHNAEACVFLDPAGRGCRLHRFALERGVEVHAIKPMICLLFPVSFDAGVLCPAFEFECDDELVCENHGTPIYRGARDDLLWYFGPELVAELDAIEAESGAGGKPGVVSLPLA